MKPSYNENGRICNTCELFNSWEQFPKNSHGFKGRRSICKFCRSKKLKDQYRTRKNLGSELDPEFLTRIHSKCQERKLKETQFYISDIDVDPEPKGFYKYPFIVASLRWAYLIFILLLLAYFGGLIGGEK